MGFSKQEYWSGCHFLLQGVFLTQGLYLYLLSPALAGRFFSTSATWEAHKKCYWNTSICLHMAYGCFCAIIAGLSSHMTDHMARKVCLVYYLALYIKRLPTSIIALSDIYQQITGTRTITVLVLSGKKCSMAIVFLFFHVTV